MTCSGAVSMKLSTCSERIQNYKNILEVSDDFYFRKCPLFFKFANFVIYQYVQNMGYMVLSELLF